MCKKSLFGMAFIVGIILAFTLTACSNGTTEDNLPKAGDGSLGSTWSESNVQVYDNSYSTLYSGSNRTFAYRRRIEEATILLSDHGFSPVTVDTSGKLTFSFAAPASGITEDFASLGLTVSPSSARFYTIQYFRSTTSPNPRLSHKNSGGDTAEYIYADRDALITGSAGGQNVYLDLKQGWNVMIETSTTVVTGPVDVSYHWIIND
jgi:hypothetical protein